MAQDIKQKIQLDGEKEYSAAIKAAQRNLRILRSELKAETAELGKNATEQQKNEAKTKSLQKQIAEQEKIVKAYQAALNEVREKYGDNEEAIARWEIKLNDARTALANMRNGLEDTGKGFKAIQDGADSSVLETKALADSFGSISSKADAMAAGMESVFTTVADAITTTISKIWGELEEVAGKADEYLDLAAYFNTSATNIQRWTKALEYAGGSMSTLETMVQRLKYGGKTDKISEIFGISDVNYEDNLQYVEVVLSKMFEMQDEMKSNGTWYSAMGEIFGKSKPEEIDGILSDWGAIMKGLKENDTANGGMFGLTEEEINKMAELNENIMAIKSNWKSLKEMAVVRLFGDLALTISGDVKGIMDNLAELMNAKTPEERQTAIDNLKEHIKNIILGVKKAITGAIEAIKEVADEFAEDDDTTISAIGKAMQNFAGALEWIVTNSDKIFSTLETLFTVYLGTKIAGVAGKIASLVKDIGLIKAFNAGGSAAGAGAGVAAGAGSGAGTAAGGGLLLKIIGSTAAKVAGGVAAFGLTLFHNAITPQGNDDIPGLTEEQEKAFQDYTAGMSVQQRGELSTQIWNADYDKEVEGKTPEERAPIMQRYWEEYLKEHPEPPEIWAEDIFKKQLKLVAPFGLAKGAVEGASLPGNGRTLQESAEIFWDTLHTSKDLDMIGKTMGDVAKYFEDTEEGAKKFSELMELMNQLDPSTPDLPSWWFSGGDDNTGLTKDDVNTFSTLPAQMKNAVQAGVSGIKVLMDGRSVGNLVAPYVSQQIATDSID